MGITKRYGGVYALKGANFSLRAGEVHALIGENGAGKSTLARILAGSTRADSGAISIRGAPVEIASPLDAQRLGIGIIYQELDLFGSLTAGENIVIGNLHFPEGRLVGFRRMEEFCRPFLRQVGLDCDIRQTVATLSIGQMQLLAIARALSMDARIILMDEPTSSLFDDAAERLFGLIAALQQRGVSIVYVSHKMDEIFRVSDRATVLRDGETIGTVEMASTSVGELIRMMVGRELKIAPRAARPVKSCWRRRTSPRRNFARYRSNCALAKSWASPDWWAAGAANWAPRSSASTASPAEPCACAESCARPAPRATPWRPASDCCPKTAVCRGS